MTARLSHDHPWPRQGLAIVAGAGRSGQAATALLLALGLQVRVLERNPQAVSAQFATYARQHNIEILFGEHSIEQLQGACLLVVSPGIPFFAMKDLAMQAGNIPCVGELELSLPFVDAPILAITGTSGKTTTASLAAAMLTHAGKQVFLGGNIGTPLAEYIVGQETADVLVLEVSSFQLQGTVSFAPHVAVLINFSENHLDHHKDLVEYRDAKLSMFTRQNADDIAIIAQELLPLFASKEYKAQQLSLGSGELFRDMQLLGLHNNMNAEAAYKATACFGVTLAQAQNVARQFSALEHRLQQVGTDNNNVTFVNDSKSTTAESLRVALVSMKTPVVLLLGGVFKGGDLAALRPLVQEKVHHIVLYGGSRAVFEEAFSDVVSLSWHADMEGAMQQAMTVAQPGDTVLLSPATSSYDQYANYIERGKDFCRLAEQWINNEH